MRIYRIMKPGGHFKVFRVSIGRRCYRKTFMEPDGNVMQELCFRCIAKVNALIRSGDKGFEIFPVQKEKNNHAYAQNVIINVMALFQRQR